MRRNALMWFAAGSLLGAASATMRMRNSSASMRRMRRNAATMTSRIARGAGQTLSSMGDDLARRMR